MTESYQQNSGSIADLWLGICTNIVCQIGLRCGFKRYECIHKKQTHGSNRTSQRMLQERRDPRPAINPHLAHAQARRVHKGVDRVVILELLSRSCDSPRNSLGNAFLSTSGQTLLTGTDVLGWQLWLCLPPAQFRRIHYTKAAGGVKLTHDLCRSLKWLHG